MNAKVLDVLAGQVALVMKRVVDGPLVAGRIKALEERIAAQADEIAALKARRSRRGRFRNGPARM